MTRKRIYDRVVAITDKVAAIKPVMRTLRSTDWRLLLFLVLFLDVKIVCKLIAIVFIYVLRPDFQLGLRWKASRLPLFYLGMIGIALADWLLYRLYTDGNYTITLVCGILNWTLCLLAVHQVRLSIERSDPALVHRTLHVFFAINAALSFLVLLKIMIATRSFNPYTYQGNYQEYFLGTGDYIKGLSFDTSNTNAFINAFGLLYFLYRKKWAMVLVCMSVLLLTGSNATVALLLMALIWPFFFRSDRQRKSMIVVCCFLVILFMGKISPENHTYVAYTATKMLKGRNPDDSAVRAPVRITGMPDSLLDPEQKKLKIATLYVDSVTYRIWKIQDSVYRSRGTLSPIVRPLPEPNINGPEYQSRDDTGFMRRELDRFIKEQDMDKEVEAAGQGCCTVPGKLVAIRQTGHFLFEHPGRSITGNGLGRFSSKQAFRSTSLGITGKYPAAWRYIDRDFRDRHLALYLFYFAKGPQLRSMLNAPDCVYDQLLAEYGLTGLALFVFLYIGFFVRRIRKLSYGIPLLFVMTAGFFTGYWFEQLSIVVLFECMIFLDGKEGGWT